MKTILAFACALVATSLLAPSDARACRPSKFDRGPAPTKAQLVAGSELIFSGKVVANDKTAVDGSLSLLGVQIEVDRYLKGKGGPTVQVYGPLLTDCRPDVQRLHAGQWWTVYASRNNSIGKLMLLKVEAHCGPGAVVDPDERPGYCSKVLAKTITTDHVTIGAGSTMTLGPDRTIASMLSVRLHGKSAFDGIALPPASEWFPSLRQFKLSDVVAIGTAQLKGRIMLSYLGASDKISGTYYAQLAPEQKGEVILEGAQMHQVQFAAPGFAVIQATLSKPAIIRGIHVQNFITFSPDGKILTFNSGRDQVLDGVRLKTCDNVDLVDGHVRRDTVYNPCKARPDLYKSSSP